MFFNVTILIQYLMKLALVQSTTMFRGTDKV